MAEVAVAETVTALNGHKQTARHQDSSNNRQIGLNEICDSVEFGRNRPGSQINIKIGIDEQIGHQNIVNCCREAPYVKAAVIKITCEIEFAKFKSHARF